MTSPLWTVREEESSDIEAITKVTSAAFLSHPQSDHTEELIISELRRSNALSLSLVVEHEGRVIGHVAFSPVFISLKLEKMVSPSQRPELNAAIACP